MTKEDDILFNFKGCYTGLLVNAESNFKNGNEANLLRNLDFFAKKDINENLSNRTLQILQSEHRKGNKHFLRIFRGELEGIQNRIERIQDDNKGNFLLNQLSISLDGYTTVWEFLVEAFQIYLVKGGKKQMSDWDFLTQTGTVDRLSKMGVPLNPTHDVNLLIEHRNNQYKVAEAKFVEERNLNKVPYTSLEENFFKITWFKGELKKIEGWLGKYSNGKRRLSTSDQIEVIKYKKYVDTEMAIAEVEINGKPTLEEGINTDQKNNVLQSTIEDWLHPFKESGVLVGENYDRLVQALLEYIETKSFPKNHAQIKVGRTNKKRFGWAINRVLFGEGLSVDLELLRFAKKSVSLYSDCELNENNFRKGNFYKYFTTKTK